MLTQTPTEETALMVELAETEETAVLRVLVAQAETGDPAVMPMALAPTVLMGLMAPAVLTLITATPVLFRRTLPLKALAAVNYVKEELF
jgi:hypothetical protein